MNIPRILSGLLSNSGVGKSISSTLGLSQEKAETAVSASVPTLLAAFSNLASSDHGAQQLANSAAQQDTSILDNLAGAVSTNSSRMADEGSNILGSLFGGQNNMINSVLSRFTGVGEGAMGKVTGMLTPIILAFLGKHAAGRGSTGIASLLSGQTENIRSAMPAGLSDMLSGSLPGIGSLFGLTSATERTSDRYRETAHRDADTTPVSDYRSKSDSSHGSERSPLRWALPVALLLALIAVPFILRRDRQPDTSDQIGTTVANRPVMDTNISSAVGAPAAVTTGTASSANLANEASRLINEASTTLGSVRDSASAQEAAPKLENINQQFSNLKTSWSSIPEGAKSTLQNTLSPLASKLETSAQSVLSMPGADSIQPQVEKLLKNVKTFTEPAQSTAPVQ